MSNDLVVDELDGHDIPFTRLEFIGTFPVAHGKPGATIVVSSLDEEVIFSNMNHCVIISIGASNQTYIFGPIKEKFETD